MQHLFPSTSGTTLSAQFLSLARAEQDARDAPMLEVIRWLEQFFPPTSHTDQAAQLHPHPSESTYTQKPKLPLSPKVQNLADATAVHPKSTTPSKVQNPALSSQPPEPSPPSSHT